MPCSSAAGPTRRGWGRGWGARTRPRRRGGPGSAGGAPRLVAQLGRKDAPLALEATRQRAASAAAAQPMGSARARLWAEVTATGKAARAQLDVELVDQTLSPAATTPRRALALEATARF